MKLTPSFWESRNVVLTGHSGFKGGWMTLLLKRLGAFTYGYSNCPAYEPNLGSLLELEKVCTRSTLDGDVKDLAKLTDWIRESHASIVFHFAAQPLVRKSYLDPRGTFLDNTIGTLNLLEAARSSKTIKSIIIITTDKVYENREWSWPYRENDALGGYDPYSASKAAAEIVTHSYRRAFFEDAGISIASARAGNVIGGGDWSQDRLIPDLIRAGEQKQPLVIRSPASVRPWQHVLEPLVGYLMLAEKTLASRSSPLPSAFNFGPSSTDFHTVESVIRKMTELLKSDFGPISVEQQTANLHESELLTLDSSLASKHLGWRPIIGLENTLKMTAEWYGAVHTKRSSAVDMTRSQVESILSALES